MMRLHHLTHVPFEGLGLIEPWALENGFQITGTAFHEHETLPAVNAFDWLVIMGGPMNIYEEALYPWLKAEKNFIARAIASGKTVLGICLGAQLIADVLGGPVRRNPHREIGWHPVRLTAEGLASDLLAPMGSLFTPFHWHGDTFAIPPGAIHLAASEACSNQAFVFNKRTVGLQFHLEYSLADLKAMTTECGGELAEGGPFVQSPTLLNDPINAATSARLLTRFLEALRKVH